MRSTDTPSPTSNGAAEAPERLGRLWTFHQQDPANQALLRDIAREAMAVHAYADVLKAVALLALAGIREPDLEAAATLALFCSGQVTSALERVHAARQEWPDDDALRFEWARASLYARQYDQVLQACRQAFEDARFIPLAAEWQTMAHWQLGQLDEARACAEHLLQQHPQAIRVRALLSAVLYDLGHMRDAIVQARQAYQQNPAQSYYALQVLASERLLARDTAACLALVDTALQERDDDGRIWLLKGAAKEMAGDTRAALADLRRAQALLPSHPGTHLMAAWANLALEQFDEAEVDVQAALAASPAFAESHGTLAVVYARRGERDAAANSIRRATLLDKQCFSARFAQTLLDGNEAQKVPELFQELWLRMSGKQ